LIEKPRRPERGSTRLPWSADLSRICTDWITDFLQTCRCWIVETVADNRIYVSCRSSGIHLHVYKSILAFLTRVLVYNFNVPYMTHLSHIIQPHKSRRLPISMMTMTLPIRRTDSKFFRPIVWWVTTTMGLWA